MGTISTQWIDRENRSLLETYTKFPLVLEGGKGVEVYDVEGNTYLDLYGGHAVSLIGHGHPHLVDAITKQIHKLDFYSNLCYLPVRTEAAEALLSILYPSMKRIFFVNSGAEANEAALKLARNHTGRERIVSMNDSFHGRTIATLSVTGIDKYRHHFIPNLGGSTDFVPFGDMEALQKLNKNKTAAIIVEPVQSMAGAVTGTKEYFRQLRSFATQHGIILIFDEIQTGFGRTGKHFAGIHWDVEPDIVTMAKACAGGIPASAVAVNGEIAGQVQPGEHGSTFGGGPIACAAIKATVDVVKSEKLAENAESIGQYLYNRLVEVPQVKEIRGMGLLCGFVMEKTAKEIRDALFSKGILAGTSVDPQVVRLLPPLILKKEHVDTLITALKELFS